MKTKSKSFFSRFMIVMSLGFVKNNSDFMFKNEGEHD